MPSFEFAPDVFSRDGFTLLVDGQAQSHVDPGDPTRLFFEYVTRIGHIVDGLGVPGQPLRVLHLGGGALTLPRYIEATRPGSTQVVVEHDGALLDAVLARLPLPSGADIELVVADARDAVSRMSDARDDTTVATTGTTRHEASAGPLGAASDAPAAKPELRPGFDLVIVDLYSGLEPPAFVASPAFAQHVLAVLAPAGLVVVNVADAAGLARLGAQARAYARAEPSAELLVAGSPDVLVRQDEGNSILVVSPGGLPHDLEPRLRAAGPHPVDVLRDDRLDFVVWGSC